MDKPRTDTAVAHKLARMDEVMKRMGAIDQLMKMHLRQSPQGGAHARRRRP
ncbi:hypothetical protein [Cupriavidus campinensis]|uniref:hypothetical protein n=1 Tax=Cupriavidus campinensis TaxID=151783 RepID=UPI00165683DB